MARVMWLPDKLREYGVKVALVPGWESRGAATLAPEVVIAHHDAVPGPAAAPGLNIVTKGRVDLPGPLCQVYLGRDGIAHIVASGKANHAGAGSWHGFSGNTQALGIEAANNGLGESWPGVQLEAYYRLCAAMLDGMGHKDASRVCGHKEWAPKRKVDPKGIDMNQFRAEVAKRLVKPKPTTQPTIGAFSTGDAVRLWQQLLVNKTGAHLTIDGSFGTATVEATKNFQKFFHLTADGVVGPKSWQVMLGI